MACSKSHHRHCCKKHKKHPKHPKNIKLLVTLPAGTYEPTVELEPLPLETKDGSVTSLLIEAEGKVTYATINPLFPELSLVIKIDSTETPVNGEGELPVHTGETLSAGYTVSQLTVLPEPLTLEIIVEAFHIAKGVCYYRDIFNATLDEDVSCYRIPALVTAPNGDLLAVMDQRVPSCADLGTNPNINTVLRKSHDNGKTWEPIEVIVDFPEGQSSSDPSLIVDHITKEVFLLFNYIDHINAPGVYRFFVMKSVDNGKTWTVPEDITSQVTKPEWENDFQFITSGRGIQTCTGKLLICTNNLIRGVHVIGSDDHGKTWYLIDTPIRPGNETKIVELADGSWMVNSRIGTEFDYRYIHQSFDEGQTWTDGYFDTQLPDPSVNASFIRYTSIKDGYEQNRLLFSNPASTTARENLTVRISYDEGVTWSAGKVIYEGSSGYSSLTILDNGDIGVLFEKDITTENPQNPFVRFSLNWLTDGKDCFKKQKCGFVKPAPEPCECVYETENESIGDVCVVTHQQGYNYANQFYDNGGSQFCGDIDGPDPADVRSSYDALEGVEPFPNCATNEFLVAFYNQFIVRCNPVAPCSCPFQPGILPITVCTDSAQDGVNYAYISFYRLGPIVCFAIQGPDPALVRASYNFATGQFGLPPLPACATDAFLVAYYTQLQILCASL